MGRLVLGLDIGITSVGYGIIDIDNNNFVDYGVRLFKEGMASNNEERRTKRGSRRLKRRKRNRIDDMNKLLISIGIKQENYKPLNNPYEIRVRGLNHKLSYNELTSALLHITKHRGSCLETIDDGEDNDDKKTKAILFENKKLLSKGKYVCEIQYQRLIKEGKVRGITNNFKTEDYVIEVQQILSHQELPNEINQKIIDIIKRKRQYYEGPGSEKSPTPYGRWMDYGVEPIDLIEKMRGKCSVFPEEHRAPKKSYTSELFNFLNDLNNLTIQNEKLSTEKKKDIIQYVNDKGGITPKQLAKLLSVDLEEIKGFRIDKNEKPLLTEFKGYRLIKKVFNEFQDNSYEENKVIIDEIAEILTCSKDLTERMRLIQEKYPQLDENLISELSHIKSITQYHSLSFKAMRMLNQEMLTSEMNQSQLLHLLKLFDKNRKSTKGQKNIFADDEIILSPVAKRAQRETFKVINALRKKYGEFDSIVIETTRDKNSADEKKRIQENQKFFENSNKKVNELLKINGYNPDIINAKTKLKVKLYLEQNAKSAYTMQPLDLNEIINNPTAYEVDHIIPISISLDDSITNKVLVTHKENQLKGNLTPINAFFKGKFAKLNCDLHTYQIGVKNNKQFSKKKKEYLLYEKDITKFSNIQDFIARNLVDTSYANKVVLNTLVQYFKDNGIDTKVHTIKGSATHIFRKRINFIKNREQDYMHHAIDALIVASIKKLNLLNTYLVKYNIDELYNEKTGEILHVKDDDAILDPKYISFISQLKVIHEESYRYYNGLIKKEDMRYPPIKISHKVDTKANRKIADETIYSTRCINGIDKVVKKYSDIYSLDFHSLTNDIIQDMYQGKYLMYEHDPQTFEMIKNIVLDHFETYKDNPDIYTKTIKKGKTIYSLKGKNNPLSIYKKENGKIRKFSKKENGPEITSMKYYDGEYGSGIDISHHYETNKKKVVLQQIKPYRTDFYVSTKGKYNFVTVRYKDVFFKKLIHRFVIDSEWYAEQKVIKGIDETWKFVCSIHHDELIGITKKAGSKYIYDLSTESDGYKRLYDGEAEILKFTATNNDNKGTVEVKPIYTYCKKQLRTSVGTFIKIEKYATDVLGNLYKVKDNVLKLEFE